MTQREEFEAWFHKYDDNNFMTAEDRELMFEAWQAAKEQAVPQWIPVSERYPEKTQGNKIWATDGIAQFECEFDDGLWCNVFGNEFTHWMPLPTAPVQNK